MRQAVIGLHEYAELSSSPLSTILFTKWLAIPLTSLSLHPEPNRLLPSTSLSLPDPPGTSSHPEFQSHQQEYRRSHSWSTHHPPSRHQYRHAFGPVLGSAAKAVMARFSHAPEEADLSALRATTAPEWKRIGKMAQSLHVCPQGFLTLRS